MKENVIRPIKIIEKLTENPEVEIKQLLSLKAKDLTEKEFEINFLVNKNGKEYAACLLSKIQKSYMDGVCIREIHEIGIEYEGKERLIGRNFNDNRSALQFALSLIK